MKPLDVASLLSLLGPTFLSNPPRPSPHVGSLARIQSQIAKHTLSRTLLSSRFKAQTKEYPHPCVECGGKMGVVEKKRKTDVDRVTLSVWCDACKVGFEV